MTKFAVLSERFEFNPRKHSSPVDAYSARDDYNAARIAVFDTIEEAREFLKSVEVSSRRFSYNLAEAKIAFIEEADFELNDDGEWEFIAGSDWGDFKFEELEKTEEEDEN